jgi:hypothetical protein
MRTRPLLLALPPLLLAALAAAEPLWTHDTGG